MATRSRDEKREYRRGLRARKHAEQSEVLAAVRSIHSVPDQNEPDQSEPEIPGAGEFERKVQNEIDGLGEVASRLSGQAGNAIAMARILDNPAAIMQHAGASGQLRAALLALHDAAKVSARSGKVRALRSRHVG